MAMDSAQEARIIAAINGVGVSGSGGSGSDASAAKQDQQIALETAILAKVIAAPATEARQVTANTSLASIDGKVGITKGAPTDGSGSLTTGGTSQQIFAANATRVYLFIQNISTGVMYINFGAAAVIDSNSIKLAANGSWENPAHFCPNGTVTIIGATTGQKFIAKQYP